MDDRQLYHFWRDSPEYAQCPICKSFNITVLEPQREAKMTVTEWHNCNDCGSDWNVVYYMSEIKFFYIPKEYRDDPDE
jgi:transposase-like protein